MGWGGGASWMIDRDGFGHSQEVVRSASGHVGLATTGGGVKLKAEEAERVGLLTRSQINTSKQEDVIKVWDYDCSHV